MQILGQFKMQFNTDGEFKHRLGISYEATLGVDFAAEHAFDIGVRFELNKLDISGLDSGEGVFGIGLSPRYS